MSNEIKLPKLVYKGCDNPKAYLLEQEACRPHSDAKPMTYDDGKEMLEKQTNYDMPRSEPHDWRARTWEEHVKVRLQDARIDDICFQDVPRYLNMDLSTVIKSMPNVSIKGFFSMDEVMYAEKQLGLRFSSDYKECLCGFGSVDIFRTSLCDFRKTDDNVIDLTKECRSFFPELGNQYYVLFDVCSDRLMPFCFLQDETGYVYSFGKNGIFQPSHSSLKELLVDIWFWSVEGYL